MRFVQTRSLTKVVLDFLDKNKKVRNENRVYFPCYFGVIGIVFSLLCGLGIFFIVKLGAPIIITIIAGAFLLPGLAMIIVWLNKRIDFDEEGFTYRSFWRIKRSFTYEQIVSCWGDGSYTLFFDDERKMFVDMLMCNSAEFFKFANNKHRNYHGGQSIPKGKKKDFFNNNLKNPSEFVAVFVLICFGWSALIGIGLFSCFDTNNTDESDCKYVSSEIVDFGEDDGDLVLDFKDIEEKGEVREFYLLAENQEEFFSLCNKKEKFDVWYKYIDEDDGLFWDRPAYYDIAKISQGETVFYGFDDYRQSIQESTVILWFIMAICTLVMAFMIVMFVVVVRNPQKFSPETVKIFIQPSSLVGYEYRKKKSHK